MTAERSIAAGLATPWPTGVASGPFRTTRLRRIEAIVSSRTPDAMPAEKAGSPAAQTSQPSGTPAAPSTRRTPAAISGPTPSPGISVTAVRAAAMVSTDVRRATRSVCRVLSGVSCMRDLLRYEQERRAVCGRNYIR